MQKELLSPQKKESLISTENNIRILSHLLNTDITGQKNTSQKLLEKAKDCFYKKLYTDISNSEYSSKKKVIDDIKTIFEKEKLFYEFPQILNKKIVGLVGKSYHSDFDLLNNIFGRKTAELVIRIKDIPVIIYPNGKEIFFVNDAGKYIALKKQDFLIATSLHVNNIALAGFIKYSCIPTSSECLFKNLIFVYISAGCHKVNNTSSRFFLDRLDFMVYIKPKNQSNSDIKIPRHNSNAIDYIVSEDVQKDILSYAQLPAKLFEQDSPVHNEIFSFDIENKIASVICFYNNTISLLKSDINSGSSDLVNVTDTCLKNSINEFIQECKNKLEKYEKELKKTYIDTNDLLKICKECEVCRLKEIEPFTIDNFGYCTNIFTTLGDLFLKYVDFELFDKASIIYNQLKLCGYKNLFACDIIFAKARGQTPLPDLLEHLSIINNKDKIVVRTKIRCSNEINFSLADYIASSVKLPDIQDLTNPNELLFYGLALEKDPKKHKKTFTNALRKAASHGSEEATKRLIDLARNNPQVMNMIGHDMIPEINYYRATASQEKGDKWLANIYFKLAATQGELRSIKKLTFIQLYSLQKKIGQELTEAEKSKAYTCISLLNHLILNKTESESESEYYEGLATLYELIQDYSRADDAWKHSNSARACYKRGMLYMYKKPLQQDLDLAEQCFVEAVAKGHVKAQEKLDKVRLFKKNDKEWKQKQSSRSYSSHVHYSSVRVKDSSPCFITTAVCSSLGKPDNCEELMTLRHYRDVLSANDDRLAVLVKEYYRVAPVIVEKIDSQPDAKEVYLQLWKKYISLICNVIQTGDSKSGAKIYIEMVCLLSKKYDVPLSEQAIQVVNDLMQLAHE